MTLFLFSHFSFACPLLTLFCPLVPDYIDFGDGSKIGSPQYWSCCFPPNHTSTCPFSPFFLALFTPKNVLPPPRQRLHQSDGRFFRGRSESVASPRNKVWEKKLSLSIYNVCETSGMESCTHTCVRTCPCVIIIYAVPLQRFWQLNICVLVWMHPFSQTWHSIADEQKKVSTTVERLAQLHEFQYHLKSILSVKNHVPNPCVFSSLLHHPPPSL